MRLMPVKFLSKRNELPLHSEFLKGPGDRGTILRCDRSSSDWGLFLAFGIGPLGMACRDSAVTGLLVSARSCSVKARTHIS